MVDRFLLKALQLAGQHFKSKDLSILISELMVDLYRNEKYQKKERDGNVCLFIRNHDLEI